MKKVNDMKANTRLSGAVDEPSANTPGGRTRSIALAGLAVAGGLIASVALAACATATHTASSSATPGRTPITASAQYSYYRSMMSGYFGGMMGGGNRWMMGQAGYRWMTGVAGVPGWMRGQALPGYMMGAGTNPGTITGWLWARAPGARVSPAQAAALGAQIPAGPR